MGNRETNKEVTVIIQVRDGDAWGQNDVIGGEEKGLDSRYILKQELSGLDMGSDGKRGVKEGGFGSPTNGEYWVWSYLEEDQEYSLDLLYERYLLYTKVEMW